MNEKVLRVISDKVEIRNVLKQYDQKEICYFERKDDVVLSIGIAIYCGYSESVSGCSEFLNFYTNKDMEINLNKQLLIEKSTNGKVYHVISDSIYYNYDFVFGFKFSELYDVMVSPYDIADTMPFGKSFLGLSN